VPGLATLPLTTLVVGVAVGIVLAAIPMPILHARLRTEQQRALAALRAQNKRLDDELSLLRTPDPDRRDGEPR
jgi:hypothetical protein